MDALRPPHEVGLENSLQGDLARLAEMYGAGTLTDGEYFDQVARALSAEQITLEIAIEMSLIPEQAEVLFGRLFSEQPILP